MHIFNRERRWGDFFCECGYELLCLYQRSFSNALFAFFSLSSRFSRWLLQVSSSSKRSMNSRFCKKREITVSFKCITYIREGYFKKKLLFMLLGTVQGCFGCLHGLMRSKDLMSNIGRNSQIYNLLLSGSLFQLGWSLLLSLVFTLP